MTTERDTLREAAERATPDLLARLDAAANDRDRFPARVLAALVAEAAQALREAAADRDRLQRELRAERGAHLTALALAGRLREALRGEVIGHTVANWRPEKRVSGYCSLCEGTWAADVNEWHEPGCLAAEEPRT